MKGTDDIILSPNDKRTFTNDVRRDVIARIGDIVHVADHLPMRAEQNFFLFRQQLFVKKAPRGKATSVPIG
jgi:hypothetical protein